MFAREIATMLNEEKCALTRLQKDEAWVFKNMRNNKEALERLNTVKEKTRSRIEELEVQLDSARRIEAKRKDECDVLGRCFLLKQNAPEIETDAGAKVIGFRVIALDKESAAMSGSATCQVLSMMNDDAAKASFVSIREEEFQLQATVCGTEERFIDCFEETDFNEWMKEGELATLAVTIRMQEYCAPRED